jgi:hypothetical protein
LYYDSGGRFVTGAEVIVYDYTADLTGTALVIVGAAK